MNLMPYKCKTKEERKCEYECDYAYYGNKPDCFVPVLKAIIVWERNPRYNDGTK